MVLETRRHCYGCTHEDVIKWKQFQERQLFNEYLHGDMAWERVEELIKQVNEQVKKCLDCHKLDICP